MRAKLLVPGQKFGRLSFIRTFDQGWSESKCECDRVWVGRTACVLRGSTRSCGCLKREIIAAGRAHFVHGHGSKHDPTHRAWLEMRRRCNNPNCISFERYGARGIKVCERWDSFANFLEDMGARPPGLSLDRIENNGNYEPDNCKWSTAKEQANNRRKRRWWKKPAQTQNSGLEIFEQLKPL